MVEKKRKRKKTLKAKKQNRHFFARFIKILSLYVLLPLTFIFISYLGYLDYKVRKQFEGKRWSLPARVYASPEDLYEGYSKSVQSFEGNLIQLGYRKNPSLSTQATYYRKGQQVYLKTRGFKFWEREEASRLIRLTFSQQTLTRIEALEESRDLPILRLDPLQIGSFYPALKEDRILVKLNSAPESLVQGILSVEDRTFYQHYGVSFRGIFRALWANFKAGGIVQGGSTVTQQLVKNFHLTPERTLSRKINEALMALILDARYGKDEILEAYVNEIFLGQDGSRAIHGFGLASEYYFGRSIRDLELEESALLVGIIKGPSYYGPRRRPKRAIERRNLVLDAMHEQGYISLARVNEVKALPLTLSKKKHIASGRYPAFMALVREQLRREYREQDLTSEGLRIFTTLQIDTQEVLEKTAVSLLSTLEKEKKISRLETAAIITRREGGEVIALIGGRKPGFAGFNRALDSSRSIGSLIKPVVYLTALEDPSRYTLTTILDDSKIRIEEKSGRSWEPQNYDLTEHGPVQLHTALAKSFNLATVRLGLSIGLAQTIKTLKNLGADRDFDLYPSLLLGAVELTPLDVTQIYQTIASDGFNTPLRTIRAVFSKHGESLQRYPLNVRQVVDPSATYLVNTVLQEAVRTGTGKGVYSILPTTFNVAGKTGTSNNLRDSWFAGFTGDYLGVVWLGRDDNKAIHLTGSSGALRFWSRVMKSISRLPADLIPPDDIELIWIDNETGLRADEECADAVQYPFIKGSAPDEYSPCVKTRLDGSNSWLQRLFGNDY